MSVVGFDVGNNRCKVAIARRRGIDIAVNDVSNRETPSLVSFNGAERFIGEAATQQVTSNADNTISNILVMLGRRYDSPEIQSLMQIVPFKIVPSETGGVLVEVFYEDKTQQFMPERIMAMLLSNLRATAEAELKTRVVDCVIAVPATFGIEQRQAMLDAARMIGLNPLRLINSTAAAALQWGFYKQPQPEGQIVAIADCGQSTLDVSVVRFDNDTLTVLGEASSSKVSSFEMDKALTFHLAQLFKENYKIDVLSKSRAKVRTLAAAEKAKRVLSANPQSNISIECVMNDVDVQAVVTREDLEQMCAPLLAEIAPTVQQALTIAGVSSSDVSTVEVIGGSSWIPAVSNTISELFGGKAVGRTLNASEAIAKGACLQCAMLSATLLVRKYEVSDVFADSVVAFWDTQEGPKEKVVFEARSKLGGRKSLLFLRDEPFNITLKRGNGDLICTCQVSNIPSRETRLADRLKAGAVPTEGDIGPSRIKVTIALSPNGTVHVDQAKAHEEYEVEVVVKPDPKPEAKPDTKPADKAEESKEEPKTGAEEDQKGATGEEPKAAEPEDAQMTDAPEAQKEDESKEEVKKAIKKKTTSTPLSCTSSSVIGLPGPVLQAESDAEWVLVGKDREIKAAQDARNNLESYVYGMREKLSESYSRLTPFIVDEERRTFLDQLTAMEDWLYTEEGESGTQAVYSDKLVELTSVGDRVEKRYREFEGRDEAVAAVRTAVEEWKAFAQTTDEKYSHITPEEREVVLVKCSEIESLVAAKHQELKEQAKFEDPTFTCEQIRALVKDLADASNPVMNKPKPKPKKEKKDKDDKEKEKKEEQGGEGKEEGQKAEEGGAQAEGEAGGEKMDTSNDQETTNPTEGMDLD